MKVDALMLAGSMSSLNVAEIRLLRSTFCAPFTGTVSVTVGRVVSVEAVALVGPREKIRDDVESGAQKQQREYFLRKQMDSIRKELGEDDASVADEYRKKIEESFGWAKTVGGMAQTVYRGVERVRARFTLTMAACNLARLPRLLAG